MRGRELLARRGRVDHQPAARVGPRRAAGRRARRGASRARTGRAGRDGHAPGHTRATWRPWRRRSGTGDAVLGPAADGGWWVLALRDPAAARPLLDVPMSTPTTHDDTLAALTAAGLRVATAATLRDVDTAEDADAVAAGRAGEPLRPCVAAPRCRGDGATVTTTDGVVEGAFRDVFTRALLGEPCSVVVSEGLSVPLPVGRWNDDDDAHDASLLGALPGRDPRHRLRSRPPGRAAGRLGHVVLGIDVVPEAVRQARERGAAAIVRDVFDPVPGEGRWDTALLADGNIGIGGDPVSLLRRVRTLLAPGGRVVVEVRRARDRACARRGRPSSAVRCAAGRSGGRWSACDAVGQPRPRRRARARPGGAARLPLVRRAAEDVVRTPSESGFASRLRSAAVAARVGTWLGVCFLRRLRHRPGQPLRAGAQPAGAVPGLARRGATGSPRGCTSPPAPPRCRCCWSSCGRSTRCCSGGSPRGRARALVAGGPGARLDRGARGGGDLPARDRAGQLGPVVPVVVLVPVEPLRRRLGGGRRAAACTSP